MSYALYSEVVPSSAVQFCVGARVLHPDRFDLVVVRWGRIEVFGVSDGRFQLFTSCKLQGKVEGLVAVRPPGYERDVLFALVRPGLLVLFEFGATEPSNQLEDDGGMDVDGRDNPFSRDNAIPGIARLLGTHALLPSGGQDTQPGAALPILVGDPNGRCVATSVVQDTISIVDLSVASEQTTVEGADLRPSVNIKIRSDLGVHKIIDSTFLEGYDTAPMLVLLAQTMPVSSGLTHMCNSSCEVFVISFELGIKEGEDDSDSENENEEGG
jgi:hypothetical protein